MLKLVLLVSLGAANAYVWPSPQLDALEALRWDQDRNGITGLVQPCDFFIFGPANSGRSNAADWIRTAYHDMATHNSTDGTGGMDASIRFTEEQARPEDIGDGFSNSVAVLQAVSTRYISIADTLAVGLILAVENCGGPEIAFRGGRVDAVEPNIPGVPEPQQDLDSHIASFSRQGFTQTEMIGLVACGHTMGGVQHDPFPDIVPELNDPNSTESVVHFDSTHVNFDNNIAIEYIAGTTKNPLVVGFNDTTNSDKRIFGSDGNATMQSFANSPDLFASTCADLLGRMVDTVPAGVQLTDVITPLPVKPAKLQLLFVGDTNTIQFSGEVRLWDLAEGANPIDSVVTVSGGRHTATWYIFDHIATPALAALDAAAGITSIHYTVDNKLEDQDGVGFAVADDVMFSTSSCFTSDTGSEATGIFHIAVRAGVDPTRVYLEQPTRDSVGRPTTSEIGLTPPTQPDSNATYVIWSIQMPLVFTAFTVGAEIDGVKVTRGVLTSMIEFDQCPT
ncbi:Peroxidase [Mycena venus]|uniref:Peroxidase n=1 Tax=Mycena venus TaxID=2733690 RepID=A0A8H6XJ04_9AGAR|nr:Peroxidase [Mycena venus]